MTHFIIPIAGAGSRFQQIGIRIPKWSLQIGEKTVLELAIESLPILSSDTLSIIALESDLAIAKSIIGRNRDTGVNNEIIMVKEILKGQARTVERGIEESSLIGKDNLVIWCGDSFVLNDELKKIPRQGNWLATTELEGNHWSFASIEGEKVIETAEKKRISNHASIGLYGFSNAVTYLDLVRKANLNSEVAEFYIAPLYNNLISKMLPVTNFSISKDCFISAGTPAEIYENCTKNNWTLPKELKDVNF